MTVNIHAWPFFSLKRFHHFFFKFLFLLLSLTLVFKRTKKKPVAQTKKMQIEQSTKTQQPLNSTLSSNQAADQIEQNE